MNTEITLLPPIYTSENPYLIENYPCGWTQKTQKEVWVEVKKGKGYRLVERTKNPKTNRWNAPKTATYVLFIALYEDHNKHLQHFALTHYSELEKLKAFREKTVGAVYDPEELDKWIALKEKYEAKKAAGEIKWVIN